MIQFKHKEQIENNTEIESLDHSETACQNQQDIGEGD